MFGKLFGQSKPVGTRTRHAARLPRVNLEKRFTIVAEVAGQGSMSKVYRALDNETGRTVCLKLQDREKTAAALARSAQEGRPTEGEVGRTVVHPNVVRTFDFGETNRREYFVTMEFIDGLSLNYVRQSRPFDLAERLELLAQAAEGLAAVHAAGFIHHDVGPKNFLVDREDRVKLIDFGLAVPNTPAFHKPGNRTGTLQYMAPELLRREPTDEKLDIFSFGATAFELLTNRLPYDAPGANPMAQALARMNQDPLDPARVNPRLPAALCDLLRKTLARRKADRWPKMDTLPDALRALVVSVG
ncbi:MAG TPA: serine/threonine-protein kinase [Isosphaeraceae bacterium]|jgi:serine/threonine protein kinase|nr:serine/threonine-protein kinase [Isosphaeraceae bacterium]